MLYVYGRALAGGGIFSITNADGTRPAHHKTVGSWIYNQSGASFSSQNVPEPGTLALPGIGLADVGTARRFKKPA